MSPRAHDKVRENRLRRLAERQELQLSRSRSRDTNSPDYGTYTLYDVPGNSFGLLDIDEVELILSGDPLPDALSEAAQLIRKDSGTRLRVVTPAPPEADFYGITEDAVPAFIEVDGSFVPLDKAPARTRERVHQAMVALRTLRDAVGSTAFEAAVECVHAGIAAAEQEQQYDDLAISQIHGAMTQAEKQYGGSTISEAYNNYLAARGPIDADSDHEQGLATMLAQQLAGTPNPDGDTWTAEDVLAALRRTGVLD